MALKELRTELRKNIRGYGMYIALFVIFVIFTITTDGIFISSRNISNLMNQTGYIAVIAIGMTLIIVIRHIDLSVGFLSGFLGAIAAIAMTFWNLPVYVVIPMVLVLGFVAGLITAYPVAKLGIPAFVASLAGWLIYRGALLMATLKTGTIVIPNKAFNAIGNGYIPDIFASDKFLPKTHKLTLLLGLITIIWLILSSVKARKSKQSYNFEILPLDLFIGKQIFVSVLIGIVTWILAGYNGLSWTFAIVLLVVAIYNFVTKKTVIGRHIYAVGGNPEAAELSGVNVEKVTFIVFGSMGMLAGLAGILYASRLQSATTTAGTLLELDGIAAAFIGGVSVAGGVGSVVGSLLGAIVYTSLTSGMNLMGIDISSQYIVRGAVLLGAVIFDVAARKLGD
ncbi:MAG: sugar ABC transporter permease [Spirochaetales bacterium]|nr:sugar ABC transporter permease [Spirochaetales bacterium]